MRWEYKEVSIALDITYDDAVNKAYPGQWVTKRYNKILAKEFQHTGSEGWQVDQDTTFANMVNNGNVEYKVLNQPFPKFLFFPDRKIHYKSVRVRMKRATT